MRGKPSAFSTAPNAKPRLRKPYAGERRLRAIRVLAAGGFALLAGTAVAPADGWYAGLGAGWSAPGDIAFKIDSPAASARGNLRLDDNVAMDVAAGYAFTFPVRLEGELLLANFDSQNLNLGSGSIPNRLSGRADIDTVFLNGLYDIPVTRFLTLDFGGGVGAARFSPELTDSVGDRISGGRIAFSWQAIAGVRVKLTESLDLQAEYRYQLVDATEHGFATASGQSAAFSMGNKPVQSVIFSIRWSLDSLL